MNFFKRFQKLKVKEQTDKKRILSITLISIGTTCLLIGSSMAYLLFEASGTTQTISADWSSIAVMAILSMYSNRGNLKKQILSMSFWIMLYAAISYLFVSKTYGLITLAVILVYPLLKFYNGEKGKLNWMKWFFYLYYPLHLVIIGILRITIYGNIPLLFN